MQEKNKEFYELKQMVLEVGEKIDDLKTIILLLKKSKPGYSSDDFNEVMDRLSCSKSFAYNVIRNANLISEKKTSKRCLRGRVCFQDLKYWEDNH